MYKKFINCLNEMCFEYKEFESVCFNKTHITAYNVVKVHNNFKDLYFEFCETGSVYTWDSEGKLLDVAIKNKEYIMIFKLCFVLNNM